MRVRHISKYVNLMESVLDNTRLPDISFHRDGQIDITSRIAKHLSLESGDVIDLIKDRGEVYIYIRHKSESVVGRHKAQCRATHSQGRSRYLRVNSIPLCRAIFDMCGECDVVKLAAGEPIELPVVGLAVPLITRVNLNYNDKRD